MSINYGPIFILHPHIMRPGRQKYVKTNCVLIKIRSRQGTKWTTLGLAYRRNKN